MSILEECPLAHPLLDVSTVDAAPREYLAGCGEIFTVFDRQDSGNISFGVRIGGERFFVKTAGLVGAPTAVFTHAQRAELLRRAVELWRSCDHPALTKLLNTIESSEGLMLVYAWANGELLSSKKPRFRALPAAEIVDALNVIYALHAELALQGWIAVDFYDSALIYDYDTKEIHVMDLDLYQPGPFRNEMGRMFGSGRFMAPEEYERGAIIDERTTVFTMGRAAAVFLSDNSLNRAPFRGNDAMFAVIQRACQPEREQRYQTLADFNAAWRAVV